MGVYHSGRPFLRNMVRAIVGTLVEVGRGKLSVEGFRKVIEEKNRCSGGNFRTGASASFGGYRISGRFIPVCLIFFCKVFPKTDRHILFVLYGVEPRLNTDTVKIAFPSLLEKLFVFIQKFILQFSVAQKIGL